MKSGYLYIVTNVAFPGWVKIGITTNLNNRLHLYQTCDPQRGYKLVYSLYHPAYQEAEKKIKEAMKPFDKSIKNEWFEVDLTVARIRLEEQLSDYSDGVWAKL
jgi:predicted GIY-YIG superfamily endonuclease